MHELRYHKIYLYCDVIHNENNCNDDHSDDENVENDELRAAFSRRRHHEPSERLEREDLENVYEGFASLVLDVLQQIINNRVLWTFGWEP